MNDTKIDQHKINNNVIHESDDINSSDLSDELNGIIGLNKKKSLKKKTIKNQKYKNNKQIDTNLETMFDVKVDKEIIESNKIIKEEKQEKDFDIGNVYQDISKSLLNYKSCKITGEIIKFKITDGNAWIDIKYKEYQLTGVFWKITNDVNYNILKTIKSGDQVKIQGGFNIMKKNLSIYFNVKSMEKFGKGDYLDLFDQYRIKIKELNLGIPKKKINSFPYSIGIITALEGAAIQDIIQTLRIDNFIGNVIIKNALVQGSQCPKSLINSIEWFEQNYLGQIDLLMITRGGGSYDDLVGFSNWELLIRISESSFITLSAVGHQIDNQLTDEICDYKFATPSIGAKFIVETQKTYRSYLSQYICNLNNILDNYSNSKKNFDLITKKYPKIIERYDIISMSSKIKNYQNILYKIISRYSELKNEFYSKLSNLKPTINRINDSNSKSNELVSIYDFISSKNNKEIKPKKIEINLIDGKINLTYKIISYEQY